MNKQILHFIFFVILTTGVYAQDANSWINYDQQYYKIKIAEDGIYRISAGEMQSAGIPITTIASGRYQMFRRGEEIAIRVNQSNNIANSIDFYGQKNIGDIDEPLYSNVGSQPHQYYNLYSDSAAYFLTWSISGQTGKRFGFSSKNDATGLSPESYYLKDTLILLTSNYARGRSFGPSNTLNSAKYDFGEGWTGSSFGKGSKNTFNLNLQDAQVSGPDPLLEVVIFGRNNLSHQVDLLIGNDVSSMENIGVLKFSGQSSSTFNGGVNWNLLQVNSEVILDVVATGLPGQSEQISIASVKLTYPAQIESLSSNMTYTLRAISQRLYLRIPTTQATNFEIFDVSNAENPIRITQNNFSDRLEFVIDPESQSKTIYLNQNVKSIAGLSKVTFQEINFESIDYLILTHPEMRSLINGLDPVDEYQKYRASSIGGSYSVESIEIQDVYDQFGYGDISPLAIRNMVLQGAALQLENVLIIGKGTTLNNGFYRKENSTLKHFVPTFGFPGSDALFGVGATETTLAVSIGRINAITSGQVLAYLNKVKGMESLPFDELWRKDFLQLSGGQTPNELAIFASYIKDFKQKGEGDFLGGRAYNRNKESSAIVEVINIANRINQGVALVTFFGHSSSSATDIEVGLVSQAEDGYTNNNKYPVFLVNGCNAGEIFGNTITFGEDWLLTADLGAVGFIAHSDFALSSALKQYSNLFYQYAFADDEHFGSTIGEITRLVSNGYFARYGTGQLSQSQVYSMIIQADPALKVFGATKPDFDINEDFITFESIEGANLTANSPAFHIKLNIKNFGKTTKENLDIKVKRTFPDGSVIEYLETFKSVLYQDTLRMTITNNAENQQTGINSFQIELDPDDLIDELNEINNNHQVEYFFAEGSAIILFPVQNATVSSEEVILKYQSANFLIGTREYAVQVDTVLSFDSPFKQDFLNSGDLVLQQAINLNTVPDSTAVFWRVRFSSFKSEEDTSWVNGCFSKIAGSTSTWSQVSNQQLTNNDTEGLTFDNQQNQWDFTKSERSIEVNTHGIENSLSYEDYRVVFEGLNLMAADNPNDPFCRLNTINAVVFDNQTGAAIRPFGISGPDIFNNLVCGQLPQMIHNFTENDVLGANRYLDSLISVSNTGTSFLIFSLDSVTYSNWDNRLKNSLASIGIDPSAFNALIDGQPIVLLGKKGLNIGDAEVLISDGSGIPPKQQSLKFVSEVVSKLSQGSMTSEILGPAQNWQKFDFNISEKGEDVNGFNILGINNVGNEAVLQSVSRAEEIDISTIDADKYPYVKLRWFTSDFQSQTPSQINGWSVSYQSPPEGVLRSVDLSKSSLHEGEKFVREFQFLNVSDVDFEDSIQAIIKMTNVNSGSNIYDTLNYQGPKAGDTTSIMTDFNTIGQTSDNNLLVTVKSSNVEQYALNNIISFPTILNVILDETNPVLDVTFDGNYILSGDIISPNPQIQITVKDENQFLFNDDTSSVSISLKSPCEGCDFARVLFSSNQLNYSPATSEEDFNVEYLPGPLVDGVYYLKVQATDKTGNQSGTKPFETSFEVINESSLSHFYPYPNPFSTSMQFVFTLTGSELPEAIKVQIMTVSGRVVREISELEIGSIKIGHNITDSAWDGKDEFGDQLANGVYFYKVFTKKSGEPFKHFDTTADRAFKNGFGKIYLLR
ncbi:MAG: hypothetical protein ACI93L_001755 [Cyclobacteriaceae bacterium]|jgi:hypothetical protein